jgi:hypothetical protein
MTCQHAGGRVLTRQASTPAVCGGDGRGTRADPWFAEQSIKPVMDKLIHETFIQGIGHAAARARNEVRPVHQATRDQGLPSRKQGLRITDGYRE